MTIVWPARSRPGLRVFRSCAIGCERHQNVDLSSDLPRPLRRHALETMEALIVSSASPSQPPARRQGSFHPQALLEPLPDTSDAVPVEPRFTPSRLFHRAFRKCVRCSSSPHPRF